MKNKGAEQYYDSLADKYDFVTQNIWNAPDFIEGLTLTLTDKNTNVLDIGIGTGQSIQKLFASKQFSQIEGIDVSDKILKICKDKFPSINLHHGDFLSFSDFRLSKYDLIICCGTLEFISDLNTFFEKCKSILTSKGNLVLTFEPKIYGYKMQSLSISNLQAEEPLPTDEFLTYRYDIDEFYSLATKNGFEIHQSKLFVAYKKLNLDIIYSLVHLRLA
jgi:ubiquinone/menaquinone biosynthesis C-methylase UbiE